MLTVIVLGNRKQIPVKSYVEGIKKAKANPDMLFKHGLCSIYPTTGREIVREFYQMVQDHCNRGIAISRKDKYQAISSAWKNGKVSNCKWCGQEFVRKNPHNDRDRFCSDSCRRDYDH